MSKDSTRERSRSKSADRPAKPYPDFPLYAHPLGYWSKKIRKKIIHFGRWGRVVKGKMQSLSYEESWQAAKTAYDARKDDAHAGRIVEYVVEAQPAKRDDEGITVKALCNQFLTAKYLRLSSRNRKLSPRTFVEYRQTTDTIVQAFGGDRLVEDLGPSDFASLSQ